MVFEAMARQVAEPLVSVALCVHNGAGFLREQIESVLAQSEPRLEVIALDDASTDGSLALLHEYAARDARVRVISNPHNLGPSPSFERAMALGTAPFIAPCDQDDIWHPHKLARLLASIGAHDLAYADSAYIDERGRSLGRSISDDLDMLSGRGALRFAFANTVSGHAALLRRDLFEAARPFPPELFHDWWLALVAAARNGLVYLDEPLVRFRRHDGALTALGRDRQRSLAATRSWLAQCRGMLAALSARTGDERHAAARLLTALDLALVGGSRWPLLGEIWRSRRALAPRPHAAIAHAIGLQQRVLRRLRRVTRDEPDAFLHRIAWR
ncbi:MAG: glycosyltransferase family 2 protein [Rhodanobacteraceae bacterium]|jgi:hypothetical protein|nr:glycosyltransferase family 2 protein [Rhodanobacteraceae bacterium]